MSSEKPLPSDFNALAAEALDLWQEHLATSASDPGAKAELMRLLEPSRRLFADWASMMQHGAHGTGASAKPTHTDAPATGAEADSGLHLMTALCASLSLPIVWPNLKNGSLSLSPGAQARLQKLRALQPEANPAFDEALTKEAVARARRFIAGVRAYRRHPARRNAPSAPVVWQAGTTILRDYNPRQPDAPVIIVIPSLINRFDILDLDRNHSFLRTLAEQGFRPLVVDWNVPGVEEKDFTLTDYVMRRLVPILDFAVRGDTPVHILGYCMGGLLALALAALKPRQICTLTLMATPWDFHRPDPGIGPQFLALAEQMEPHLQTQNHLPVDFIQSLFALLQPMQVVAKFTEAASLDPSSSEARQFVLLEDWLNDGVPLTAPVARECLRHWYGENRTARMEWSIDGHIIDPRALAMPVYVLAPGKDRVVPPESALPLAKLFPHATLHEPMMGHIGLIASRHAPQQVWAALTKWLAGHR